MSTTISCTITPTESEHRLTEPMKIDISAFQDIVGRDINPTKLMALLRMRFGVDRYEIHVRCFHEECVLLCSEGTNQGTPQMIHDVYSVRAPERLSQNDIESCK